MNILLTGAAGQLGGELLPRLRALGEVIAVDRGGPPRAQAGWRQADLSDGTQLERLLGDCRPDLVVNAAAYTAVDGAESEPEAAWQVNAELPARLAHWAGRHGAAVLHYSTDYVFDGSAQEPYVESHPPAPLNVYGETKLAGEQALRSATCRSLVLRTSWVYSAHGHNFVRTMLRLARDRDELSVVDDQIGCPTWARSLARASLQCIRSGLLAPGGGDSLYHYCDRDAVSWFDFAGRIFATARRLGLLQRAPKLQRIDSESYPQAARRPRYSVLNPAALVATAGVEPAGLDASLTACMKEMEIDE